MNRVVHFEFGAEEPKRLADFFTSVFGWKIEKWNGPMDYWMVMTGKREEPGIDGGIYKREMGVVLSEGYATAVNSIVTVDVADIAISIEMIKKFGGEVIQDKQEIMKDNWVAYAKDTEGNIFGIFQGSGEM